MILYAIHRTTFRYPTPSVDSLNEVRLMPLDGVDQLCLEFDLTIHPSAPVFDYREPGGQVHHFAVRAPHRELSIVARAVVDTRISNPFAHLNLLEPDWDALSKLEGEFLIPTTYVPHLESVREFSDGASSDQSVAAYVIALGELLHDRLDYDPDATHVHSTLPEVLAKRAGVCQDFAHLMLACCRMRGIPSRYVSGYLYVGEGEHLRGNQATHAWVECLMPSGVWLGIDPTNRQLANDHYIRVHTGRDYGDVTPTRGIYTGSPCDSLEVSVTITRDSVVEHAAV